MIPLVEDGFYHLFNRSINREPIFALKKDCLRALKSLEYYQFQKVPVKFSYFLSCGQEKRGKIIEELKRKDKRLIDIISFCLMPNHFHLLLKQRDESGIRIFLSLFQNSYTRYFNTKHGRAGPIFQGIFKAVRIETDEQLTHLSRYIHHNPYSSFITKPTF